ncbi:carbohydrate-binding protein [uncultured Draconibacterium sp.]|uniref:carbohydrate-binding protein n=1 Tax=uncultured Draconibacterium sp. TaxID=1573823 RepID=UPI0029C7220D|nr:carbohydrate-binding protein [uncultured Draconibacterium sp.]
MKNFTYPGVILPDHLIRKAGSTIALLLAFIFLLPVWASAERIYPDMSVQISSGGSDYALTFTYSGAGVVSCTEAVVHRFDIYKNTDSNSSKTISGSGSKSSGTITYVAGPNNSGYWGLRYQESEDCSLAWCNCVEWVWSGYPRANSSGDRGSGYSVLTYAATAAIKSPTGITASDQEYFEKIILSWSKGTDIPDANVGYNIYRGTTTGNGALIAQVAGDVRTWTDETIVPNDVYYYWVTTFTDDWGNHESPRNSSNAVLGKAKTFNVNASDGTYTNRVKVEWDDLSDFAEELRIERSVPESSQKEELAILSKNAQAYSDDGAIPGYKHTYYVTPIHATRTFPTLNDDGYSKPNGTIKGTVKSVLSVGVEGVSVCAIPVTPNLPAGALTVPSGGYCTTTDVDGYYEIRNIYYYDEAEFIVVPYKDGPNGPHIFTPDTITRVLDLNSKLSSGANFTDESVFSMAGRVVYPKSTAAECGVPEVEILINGESRGIFTDANGDWSYAIQEEGDYTFTPEFLHHTFENPSGQPSTSFFVAGDSLNINFTDTQTDTIFVKVQTGCETPVADSVKIQLTSPGNCFNTSYYTDANGLLTIPDLPAREYDVQVVELDPVNSNIFDQIGNKPIRIDLTVRDTADMVVERDSLDITPADTIFLPNGTTSITPADTTLVTVTDTTRGEVIPEANFIYHSPLDIQVDFADAGAQVVSCSGGDITLMQQNDTYTLVFEVNESMGDCPVNEGYLRIFDFVADRGDEPIEVPIVNGFAVYTTQAGLPEIAESAEHNHEKLLYVVPEVGFLDATPQEYWIMVEGVKTQAPSFITKSPEMPMLVLHDPPGDNSYSYVQEGKSYKSFNTFEMLVGGEAGVYANLLIGAKVLTPFSSNGFGTQIKFSAVAGRDNYDRNGVETTITFNETFSTSDLENLTGNDGDVYIGASFNQEYALGDELTFNTATCQAEIKTVPTIDVTGFATTFVYTETHIKNTLLPTLGVLRSALIAGRDTSLLSPEEKMQANQLLADSLHWEEVLAQNDLNRGEDAVFKENISFSAGAPYTNEYTTDTTNSASFEYSAFINTELAAGIKLDNESGAWFDSEIGVMAKFRWANTFNQGNDTTYSRTVGYILSDNDIGDFFSVDILEDKAYGVPAFNLKLGTSSCPHEPGTQPRDDARITVYPPQINNVPIGGQAVFTANLLNESQSRETREYHVKVVSTTNPDGAVVKLGGTSITNSGASYFLQYNQTANIALTVERGPMASTYDSIGIMMYPPCEYSLWEDGGSVTSADTAWIFVDFQSECSNVALHLPGNNWLVNSNNDNKLDVAFTGYDRNNENLQSITLQYKRQGEGWVDDVTIDKELLLQNFYDYEFDVSGLTDGSYSLRAKANCGIEGGISYSSEQSGIIDRSSIAPYGTPSPADGYLRYGQEISVVFDKDINCNFESYSGEAPNIRLFLEDSTEIPITVQCSQNADGIILVPNDDLFAQPSLEGKRVYAVVEGIQDIFGNVQEYKTEWSFLVNVSPVSWNPEEVHITAEETELVVLSANLDNSANISKSFTIEEYPDWLVPSVTSASVLGGNSFTLQFHVVEDLLPGFYEGEVTALIDGSPEVLKVSLELYAEEIDWSVNHPDFQYNMNIVAQFSSDDGDENLSTGLRDKIAAYVDGELRGVGNIMYVPELSKYAAFITVSGNLAGENGSLLEAEDYVDDLSVQDITFTEDGKTYDATRFKKNNWIDFDIYATKAGNFSAEFKAAGNKAGDVDVFVDGNLVATFAVPVNGGSYGVYTTQFEVPAGEHTLRIQSNGAEFDLDWINFPEYHVRNQHTTEVIKFRMWDGLNGIEYGAIEELTFFTDGVVGNVEEPFILHPAGGIQQRMLAKGWNWISVNKQSDDMSVGKVFESLTPPTSLNDITLKSQSGYSQFSQLTGWQGTLADVDIKTGYMIFLSAHGDTLSLIGNEPESDVSIPLNPKWNWIGYPKSEILPIDDVLEQLSAGPGDVIKSQYEYGEYNQSTDSWVGDLKFFHPGLGYKLFVGNSDNITIMKSGDTEELFLKHEYNMTLTAIVDFGEFPTSDRYRIQTYINDQLRGDVPLSYLNPIDEYMAFAMVYGDRSDIGETVKTVMWDEYNQQQIELVSPELNFTIDKINGTVDNPVILSIAEGELLPADEGQYIFNNYPNPFRSNTTIQYTIPEDTHVMLTVTNSVGREIRRIVDVEQIAGHYSYTFDADGLADGIYYCTLKTNDFVETKKLILLKK